MSLNDRIGLCKTSIRKPFIKEIQSLRSAQQEYPNEMFTPHISDLAKKTTSAALIGKKGWPLIIASIAQIYDEELRIAGERLIFGFTLKYLINPNSVTNNKTYGTLSNSLNRTPPWFAICNDTETLLQSNLSTEMLPDVWTKKVFILPDGWSAFWYEYGYLESEYTPSQVYQNILLISKEFFL